MDVVVTGSLAGTEKKTCLRVTLAKLQKERRDVLRPREQEVTQGR